MPATFQQNMKWSPLTWWQWFCRELLCQMVTHSKLMHCTFKLFLQWWDEDFKTTLLVFVSSQHIFGILSSHILHYQFRKRNIFYFCYMCVSCHMWRSDHLSKNHLFNQCYPFQSIIYFGLDPFSVFIPCVSSHMWYSNHSDENYSFNLKSFVD